MTQTKEIDCNDHEGTDCEVCGGTSKRTIGGFPESCARHCTMCEGADHHWEYYGEHDDEFEPLMSCKHCNALRYMTQDDYAFADYSE